MRDYRIIDADCHVLEPKHIWDTYLPSKFRDDAPRLVKDEAGGDAWQFNDGRPPMKIGLVTTAGQSYEDMKWSGNTYESIRQSCFEAKARLEDMDFDGIDAEFLYPSQRTMYYYMHNKDTEFHRSGIQAYNNFMMDEFCAADPERLFHLAQMPNLGVDEAIAEMERCKVKGVRGVIISAWPAGGDQLTNEDDRFFAAAAEMGLPVSIHINIQRSRTTTGALEGHAAIGNMALAGMLNFPPIMAELITSGLFDRVPNAFICGVEVDIGWIPTALEQLDNFYWRNRTHTGLTIRGLPSDYFHRHFMCTFLSDHVGIRNRYDVGVRNMAWSTDFPHHGCDWPYSRKVIGELFQNVPQDEKELIICGNVKRIYGLDQ